MDKYILEKLRLERPSQTIHEVLSVNENDFGFYDVKVDMSMIIFETRVNHVHATLPYPFSGYKKLNKHERAKYRETIGLFNEQ